MRPGWVLNRAVLDWLPSEAVEEEDDGHHAGGDDPPAKSPVEVRLEPGHLFHAVRELLHTEDPTDGDRLKETTPENWNPASSVKVHQLEDISSPLGKMVIMNEIVSDTHNQRHSG